MGWLCVKLLSAKAGFLSNLLCAERFSVQQLVLRKSWLCEKGSLCLQSLCVHASLCKGLFCVTIHCARASLLKNDLCVKVSVQMVPVRKSFFVQYIAL